MSQSITGHSVRVWPVRSLLWRIKRLVKSSLASRSRRWWATNKWWRRFTVKFRYWLRFLRYIHTDARFLYLGFFVGIFDMFVQKAGVACINGKGGLYNCYFSLCHSWITRISWRLWKDTKTWAMWPPSWSCWMVGNKCACICMHAAAPMQGHKRTHVLMSCARWKSVQKLVSVDEGRPIHREGALEERSRRDLGHLIRCFVYIYCASLKNKHHAIISM